MSDSDYSRALEAIFEDRASAFSDDLRGLLRALFEEGVKVGRERERALAEVLVRRLDEVTKRSSSDKQLLLRDFETQIVAQHDGLPFGHHLTADDIRRTRELVESKHVASPPERFFGIDPGFGSTHVAWFPSERFSGTDPGFGPDETMMVSFRKAPRGEIACLPPPDEDSPEEEP